RTHPVSRGAAVRSRRTAGGVVAVCAAMTAVCASVLPAAAQPVAAATSDERSLYVVVLEARPLATFAGSAADRRTAPRAGHRFDARRPAVAAYAARLDRLHERVAADLGSPEILYSYDTAVDG